MGAGANCVIGFGGGSALDLGKAVAALVANGGTPLDYLEVVGAGKKLTKPSLPYVAVPTTAGDVTSHAIDVGAVCVCLWRSLRLCETACLLSLSTIVVNQTVLWLPCPSRVRAMCGRTVLLVSCEHIVGCVGRVAQVRALRSQRTLCYHRMSMV